MNNNVEKWINLVKETIQLKYANIAYKGEKEKATPTDIMDNMDTVFDEIVDIIYNFPFDEIELPILKSLSEYNVQSYNNTFKAIL